jgi:phosphotransferase system HPr (HPr) family protein
MIQAEISVINKLGLHARATAKLITLTNSFVSSVKMSKAGKTVDAKNMMAVLMLGAGKGTVLNFSIEGDDEIQAKEAITDLFNRRFDEGE